MLIRIVYSIFIGVLLAVFAGVGIAAFYPAPKAPNISPSPLTQPQNATASAQIERQNQQQYQQYNLESQRYSTIVAVVSLAIAIVYVAASLLVLQQLPIFSDGALYGGMFTLLYSVARILQGNNAKYEFGFISVALMVSLAVGYKKFIYRQ